MITEVLLAAAKVAVLFGAVLTLATLLTWAERKESALMQDRIGPNRASLFGFRAFGLFHPIADALKSIMKEDFIPAGAHRAIHVLAPFVAVFPPLAALALVPFGPPLPLGAHGLPLQIAHLDVGILFLFALSGMAIYGAVLAGWSSNNNWSLLGGMRASAQMFSYEVMLGLSALGVLLCFNTLDLAEVARRQTMILGGWVPGWGILYQPAGFILFLTAAMAETKRAPFDLPEGDSEIIGYFLEFSGMKYAMFLLAEFIEVILISMVVATLYFGGWQVPFLSDHGFVVPKLLDWTLGPWAVALLRIASLAVKTVALCWFLLLVRWTLPRFRFDQLMRLGWKMCLPLALANLFLTAVGVVALGRGA